MDIIARDNEPHGNGDMAVLRGLMPSPAAARYLQVKPKL
jgi:hypothetical protein